ncbi:hypothetical protein Adt_32940 [Abeliophyllum distichum]|uniref:Uncharacterized protein n=1 Tax=Abeliophyllum distichum TaxID=126358 RepID=A0ABD1QUT8_9LAMI
MSSRNDDSQNQSDARTNSSIQDESPSSASLSSSSEVVGEMNQGLSAACPSTLSTSGIGACLTSPLKKAAEKGDWTPGVPKMKGLLDKRDVPVAKALDEELKQSDTEASMARSRIAKGELEDMRLSYDISASVILRAPGPKESTDDPPEGFVAIYEPAM